MDRVNVSQAPAIYCLIGPRPGAEAAGAGAGEACAAVSEGSDRTAKQTSANLLTPSEQSETRKRGIVMERSIRPSYPTAGEGKIQ